MTTRRIAALTFGAALATSPAAYAEPFTYELDPEHTVIAILVDHVGFSRVLGQFTEVAGSFTFDEETMTLSDLEVRVPTASFWSNNEARDNHVRNADFLDVENHPEMVFTASDGSVTGEGEGVVEGELTLIGETRPVSIDVTLNKREEYPFGHQRYTLGISGTAEILRSEWGMDYGVANGLVGDEVEIIIETEALREG